VADPEVVIDYTNWRGERSLRRIRPLAIAFENNEWHPETQWLLEAVDLEKGENRTFAMNNIHSWNGSPPPPSGDGLFPRMRY
jgi:predicted DNA-binding transcriptional regulator YafY